MAEEKQNKEIEEENIDEEKTEETSTEKTENDELKEKLEKVEEELAETKANNIRLQADFENLRKISEKQKMETIKYANEQLIEKFLDCYEDFSRVLENATTKEELEEGVNLIHKKMTKVLKDEGLEEIPAKGEKFDPNLHEALLTENNENYEDGDIIEELMKGYKLKDKVLKYSKVKVCKK